MIIDSIDNAKSYLGISQKIATALKYLSETDFSQLELGRHEIGDGSFCVIQDYMTAPRNQKRWEAHRRYIDVQFVASGVEHMGWAQIDTLQIIENYNEQNDIEWFDGKGDFVTARTGTFVIVFPHDAHMPGVALEQPELVRKVVVKVPLFADKV